MRFVLACAVVVSAGCGDDPAVSSPAAPVERSCAPLPAVVGQVQVASGALHLGGQRFRALGANLYYLQQLFAYGGGDANAPATIAANQSLDELPCLAMPVARTLGFNDTSDDPASIRSAPGVYHEAGWLGLDRTVAAAKARGVRLILILTNNWPDYGGLFAYARWAGRAHDDFFSNADMKSYWKDYVSRLLNRVNTLTGVPYAQEPAILGWEIANELRCRACVGTTQVVDTVRELALHLKASGAQQLVMDGSEGFDDAPGAFPGLSNAYSVSGQDGEGGAPFSQLLTVPELDLVSYHLYPDSWGMNPSSDVDVWIDAHERLARSAGKVAYMGEFGLERSGLGRDALRAAAYDGWLRRFFGPADGTMAVVWQVIPASRRPSADDGFGIVPEQDVATARALVANAPKP